MSSRKRDNFVNLEMMRQRVSMGKQIVDHVDERYGVYAGIDAKTSLIIKNIDHFKKYKDIINIPESDLPMLDMMREYYDEKRKALFATIGCDVFTKLSFISGIISNVKSGTRRTDKS